MGKVALEGSDARELELELGTTMTTTQSRRKDSVRVSKTNRIRMGGANVFVLGMVTIRG